MSFKTDSVSSQETVCRMDDLLLTDHKGNIMARIECESLFVPNQDGVFSPNLKARANDMLPALTKSSPLTMF